jgi:sugar phosphate isomerase/epimerase
MLEIGSQINEVRVDGDLDCFRNDLAFFQSEGLEAVEISPHGLDVIKNGKIDRNRLKEIKTILKNYSFHYTVHAPNPLNLMDKERSVVHLSVFRSSIQFSLEIGADILVYHGGRYFPEEAFYVPRKKWPFRESLRAKLDREITSLRLLAEEFPEIKICIENARPYRYYSPYCYAERLQQLVEVVQAVNLDNVGITLDFGHFFMSTRFYQDHPLIQLEKAVSWIGHCHVHDNHGDAVFYNEKQQTHQIPFGKGDSHMPVGWGEIPFSSLLEALLPFYQGCFIMELRSRYFKQTKTSLNNFSKILSPLVDRTLKKETKISR